MTRDQRRKAMLVGAAGVLAIGVALDRAGFFSTAGGEGSDADRAASYLQQAALVERNAQLAHYSDAWQDVLAESRSAFQRAVATMIVAPSPELAADRLRRQAEAAMNDLGIKLTVSAVTPARTPLENEPLRVVGLQLDFDAPNPDVVFRLIDRLENLPDTRTHIGSLALTGPGPGVRTGLRVSMKLEALALITPEAAVQRSGS